MDVENNKNANRLWSTKLIGQHFGGKELLMWARKRPVRSVIH